MKAMTEQQMQEYRAYRQGGGTATTRAWLESKAKNGAMSARAQATRQFRDNPRDRTQRVGTPPKPPAGGKPSAGGFNTNAGGGTPPQIAGDVPPKPVHGVDPGDTVSPGPAALPSDNGPIVQPLPASAKMAAGGSVGAVGENAGTAVDQLSGGKAEDLMFQQYNADRAAAGAKPMPRETFDQMRASERAGAAASSGTVIGNDPPKGSGTSNGKPGPTPATGTPAGSGAVPVDQGSGNDATTATVEQVQARARLWNTRMSELEAAAIAGQISPTEYMRENQRFEAFMAAAESGDYAGAMAAQNPFDAGQGTNAAPRRDLAAINAERTRAGLRPISQDVYDAMPERGAQIAGQTYNESGAQILSGEYGSESGLKANPRLSGLIGMVNGDLTKLKDYMQRLGGTTVIDDVTGMSQEQLSGHIWRSALEAFRANPGQALGTSAASLVPPTAPQGPTPASGKMAAPEQSALLTNGPDVMPPVGGGQTPAPGSRLPPGPEPTKPPQEINPVGGPKPGQGPLPPIGTGIGQQIGNGGAVKPPGEVNPIGGPKPATTMGGPSVGSAVGAPGVMQQGPGVMPPVGQGGGPGKIPREINPVGGPKPAPVKSGSGNAAYMDIRQAMSGKPQQDVMPPQPPPSGKMPGMVSSAASAMRGAVQSVANGAGAIGSAIGGGVAAIGNAARGMFGGGGPEATSQQAAANLSGGPAPPSGARTSSSYNAAGGGLTSAGEAAFGGAQISQNQQRSREQAVAYMQANRGMK